MSTQFLLKRLPASDLGMWSAPFHAGKTRSKQKCINLNMDVFGPLFPHVQRGESYRIPLEIEGPSTECVQRVESLITRSMAGKNWRLGQILVPNPADEQSPRPSVTGAPCRPHATRAEQS